MNIFARFFKFLACGALLLGAQGSFLHATASDPCRLYDCWEFGASLLYWKPCTSDFIWAEGVPASPNITSTYVASVAPTYDFGLQLEGGYHSWSSCWFLLFDWTYFRSHDRARPAEFQGTQPFQPNLFGLVNENIIGKAKLRTLYNRVNARFGRPISTGWGGRVDIFTSVCYDLVRETREGIYQLPDAETPTIISQSLQFSGVGIAFGLGAEIQISGALAFFGETSLRTLVGDRQRGGDQLVESASGLALAAKAGRLEKWVCVPAYDFRVGVEYVHDGPCGWVAVGIGYEHHHYWSLFSVPPFLAPAGPLDAQSQDIGFAGPFVTLSLRF